MLGEILFELLSPIFKTIGVTTRWVCCLGKTSFKEIVKKDNNTRVGFIMSLLLIFILMFVFH